MWSLVRVGVHLSCGAGRQVIRHQNKVKSPSSGVGVLPCVEEADVRNVKKHSRVATRFIGLGRQMQQLSSPATKRLV